jgi:hypothetical protein
MAAKVAIEIKIVEGVREQAAHSSFVIRFIFPNKKGLDRSSPFCMLCNEGLV